jgi:outer membrane protein
MKIYLIILLGITAALQGHAQSKMISLPELIQISLSQSTNFKIAQSIKDNKNFQFNNFKIGLRPQLTLSGNAADFSHDYLPVVQPDGTIIFQPRLQNYSSLNLSLSQQISATGGSIAINSNLVRFDDFDRRLKQYSGIPINLSINQPLFAFNNIKWDKRIQVLKHTEAEKDFIHDIYNISLQSANYFFEVILAQIDLDLAGKNLKDQKALLKIEERKINLGTTTLDKILQLKLQMLRSVQEESIAGLNRKSAVMRLKNFSGINDTTSFVAQIPMDFPSINITSEKAIEIALNNRSEIVAYKRKRIEAERDLEQARRDRFKANVIASVGLNNTASRFANIYEVPNSQQSFTLGLSLPLIDWNRRKSQIDIAESNLKTVVSTNVQDELSLKQEIITLVDNIQLIYKNIEVAKETDSIAQQRSVLINDQFKFGKVSVTELGIASSEKDNAKRALISSIKEFWISFYQLQLLIGAPL